MPGGPKSGGMGGLNFGSEAQEEMKKAAQTVRQLGNRTFYLREGRWIDSTVSKKQEAEARRIKQFSDAYFDLAKSHGGKLAAYLVFDEPVLLEIEGQAYWIEP